MGAAAVQTDSPVSPQPLTKMQYLIKRRDGVSRDELITNWFANHMPDVIAGQQRQAERGRSHARRYIATLFDPARGRDRDDAGGDDRVWDGVAQLWWDEPTPPPSEPHGTDPRDTFQQKAEPYRPWVTTEYLVMDGELPVRPNTLNQPFPCTRSGFFKVTALIVAKPGADHDAFRRHWLGVHATNVAEVMSAAGGFRYAISLSDDPTVEPYAGMAELYFPDRAALSRYQERFEPDGMDTWVDRTASLTLPASTEMVGIP